MRDLLQQALACQNPDQWLGLGADVREHGKYYNHIELQEAWRVQQLPLWYKYCMETSKMHDDLSERRCRPTPIQIRPAFGCPVSKLPGPKLRDDINETFLLHGTDKPATVNSLLRDGFNERFNGRANFGYGSYLAEDAGKCDQYVAKDEQYDAAEPLHKLLFAAENKPQHPGNIYWMLLTRAAIGHAAVSVDAEVDNASGGVVWAHARERAKRRELAFVPNVIPELRFHSLVVETSDLALFEQYRHRRVYRYREFIFTHGERLYPEYLLAVRRVLR